MWRSETPEKGLADFLPATYTGLFENSVIFSKRNVHKKIIRRIHKVKNIYYIYNVVVKDSSFPDDISASQSK